MSRCRISWMAQVALPLICFCSIEARAVSQPWNLGLVGRQPGVYGPVQVVGRYAYIGGENSSHQGIFRIFDVSNPASPVELGSLLLPPSYVDGFQVSGTLAYLANGTGGLKILDVTNPTSPTLRGTCAAPRDAWTVFISGHLAYVADGFQGLRIIDVINPTSPTLCGSYNTPDLAVDVFVSGGLAYVADRASLQILDVTNPTSPTFRGAYSNPSWGSIWDVFVSNRVAYVTATSGTRSWTARFLSLDVTNPAAPKLLSSYSTPGVGSGIHVSRGLAYVVLGDGLRIFNIGTPSSPVLRGFYPLAPSGTAIEGWVFVSGNLVYMVDSYASALTILRYTGPPAAASRWRLYR